MPDHLALQLRGSEGGLEHAKLLLTKSLSEEDAKRVIKQVTQQVQTTPFSFLQKAESENLLTFIQDEHPQTIALILAHLHASSAAQLIALLPESLRVDVLTRMASLEDISPDVVTRISAVIEQRLKTLGGPSREQHGGVRAVAELFNRLERTISTSALEAIEARKPELAVSIRNLMFVFEDLLHVDDNGMREIVSRADKKALTIALKGASEEIRQEFSAIVSQRLAGFDAGELRLAAEVLRALSRDPAARWGCIFVDIDHFKRYNDEHGHQAGDRVLVRMARFLMRHVRAEESVVRVGGDEFVIVLNGADANRTRRVSERLRNSALKSAPVSFSLGWASREPGEPLVRLLDRADRGLLAVRDVEPQDHQSQRPQGCRGCGNAGAEHRDAAHGSHEPARRAVRFFRRARRGVGGRCCRGGRDNRRESD